MLISLFNYNEVGFFYRKNQGNLIQFQRFMQHDLNF